jgi:ABC-2 type transport system permease protein
MSEAEALPLQDVPGPSALGGGWQRFFELLWLISATEFKKTYFGTVLGYAWSLVRPLLLFGVLLVVFTKILKFGGEVPHYAVLLLFNIVLFGFFQESTSSAVTSVLAQEGIVRKTQFPRLVIPLATVVVATFTLAQNLVAVLVFLLIEGIYPTWTWLLFPLLLIPLFILTASLSMLLSALNVRFRDVAIIWTVAATALFYATPVLYPITIEGLPQSLKTILLINPLTPILEQARAWVIDPTAPGAVEAAGGWVHLLPAMGVFCAVVFFGIWVFRREAPNIAESL